MSSAGKQIIFLSLDDLLQRLMSYQFTDKFDVLWLRDHQTLPYLISRRRSSHSNKRTSINYIFFCLGLCRRLAHNKLHRLEKGTFKDLMNLQELYFVSFYLNILAFSVVFFCWSAM